MGLGEAADIFSFGIGGLAIISALFSVLLFLRGYLPAAQMKILDDLLNETKEIYEKAEADGLLPNNNFRHTMKNRLTQFEVIREILRGNTYQATTSQDQIRAFIAGLSKTIMAVTSELKKLRWYLVSTTQREKARHELENQRRIRQAGNTSSSRGRQAMQAGLDGTTSPILDVAIMSSTTEGGAHVRSSTSRTSNLTGGDIPRASIGDDPSMAVPEFDLSTIVTASYQVPSHCLRCSLGIHTGCVHPGEQNLLPISYDGEDNTAVSGQHNAPLDKPASSRLGSFIRFCVGRSTGSPDPDDPGISSRGARSSTATDVLSRSSTLVAESITSSARSLQFPRWSKPEVSEDEGCNLEAPRPSYFCEVIGRWKERSSGRSTGGVFGRDAGSLPV